MATPSRGSFGRRSYDGAVSIEGQLNVGEVTRNLVTTRNGNGSSPPSAGAVLASVELIRALAEQVAAAYIELDAEAYTCGGGNGGRAATDASEPDLVVVNVALDRSKADLRASLVAAGEDVARAIAHGREAVRVLQRARLH